MSWVGDTTAPHSQRQFEYTGVYGGALESTVTCGKELLDTQRPESEHLLLSKISINVAAACSSRATASVRKGAISPKPCSKRLISVAFGLNATVMWSQCESVAVPSALSVSCGDYSATQKTLFSSPPSSFPPPSPSSRRLTIRSCLTRYSAQFAFLVKGEEDRHPIRGLPGC